MGEFWLEFSSVVDIPLKGLWVYLIDVTAVTEVT